MKPVAKDLALAILTRLWERDATPSKTKLLKLLYLADIEHVRKTGETLTGFNWIFYLFGPWTAEYDQLLAQLEAEGALKREPWVGAGLEGERIRPVEHRELGKVISETDEYFRVRRLLDVFGDLATPELLDYVYFETEPMAEAERDAALDFSKVSREAPKFYRRSVSGTPRARTQELERKFRAIKEQVTREADINLGRLWRPTYDEHYERALEVLNAEGEE